MAGALSWRGGWKRWGGVLAGCILLGAIVVGSVLAQGIAPGDPATMDDVRLAAYLQERLADRDIAVASVTVTGEGTGAREAAIELETKNIEAVNPVLPTLMANVTDTIRILVDERNTHLDYYSVKLRDEAGAELLSLRVDINNMSSQSHQDPRVSPLWLSPPPNVIKWWSETYGK